MKREMELLIVAAGNSSRMGIGVNKILLPLLGKPLLAWTLAAVNQAETIRAITLVVSEARYPEYTEFLRVYPSALPVQLVGGGATRQESVARGLAALPEDTAYVLIHDGARCLVSANLIDQCAQVLMTTSGVIAAIPVKDTIKEVDPTTNLIYYTPPREKLWAAQTPQGFAVPLLCAAHAQAQQEGWAVTDDAALFERLGYPVQLVLGEETNLKVTTPLDVTLAECILQQRMPH